MTLTEYHSRIDALLRQLANARKLLDDDYLTNANVEDDLDIIEESVREFMRAHCSH